MGCFKSLVFTCCILTVRTVNCTIDRACPRITCPSLSNGEDVKLVLKEIVMSVLPENFSLPPGITNNYYCVIPACLSNPCQNGGCCVETIRGFNCTCSNGYQGERCERAEPSFIHSVKLLGGNETGAQGSVAFTSSCNHTKYMLVHHENWSSDVSRLVCQYLGYEDVYATVGGNLFEISSLWFQESAPEVATVTCPLNVKNITSCSLDGGTVNRSREETIGVVCCSVNRCNKPRGFPVGLESGTIVDSNIIASSEDLDLYFSGKPRLNGPNAWIARSDDQSAPWLKVHLQSLFVIAAILTQGRADTNQWVTSYKVDSSLDDVTWTRYLDVDESTPKIFTGNYDRMTAVVNSLQNPLLCRFFRIYPNTYYGHVAMRIELTGYGPINEVIAAMNNKQKTCQFPAQGERMGVADGRIPDSSLTASSSLNELYTPSNGRLDGGLTADLQAAWIAADDDTDKYVKVDLGHISSVTGVITQGRFQGIQWITSLRLSHSTDDVTWIYANEPECDVSQVYAANYDRDTHKIILFPRPVTARYVRIHPLTWIGHQALRYEILGLP